MIFDYPTAFQSWDLAEHEAITRVRLSGRYTMGPETEAFEAEYAAWHGRKHCVMVNSGSSANLIAVAALLHTIEGKQVAAVPAIAWATTYAPLVQHGVDLRVLDIDETWNADPMRCPRVDIVVGCSILGNPAHLQVFADHAEVQDAFFLNDDCESLGARINGRTTASYGDIATSSFFWSHQLSAIEGGAILTDDDDLARLCRLLRNHGNAGFLTPDASFDQSYDFQLFGYNVRPLELHAAIAREQLKKLDGFIDARRKNYWAFDDLVDGLPIRRPEIGDDSRLSPFGLHFTVESKDVRARLVAALRAASIDARLPTGGSFTKHAYGAPWRDQPTPNADRIHDTGLFLGNAPWPIEDKIEKAVKIMRSVL